MTELYATDAASIEDEMGIAESPADQTGAPAASAAPRAAVRPPPQRPAEPMVEGARHVCPFCGSQNPSATAACPRCTMEDSLATREATKARIGPWFVLQTRNPAAPGMKYGTLLSLVAKGHVTARSIVRGPTTHQLWRFASQVRGLSREFGMCYSCGQAVEKTTTFCLNCERPQEPIGDPDVLLEQRDLPVPPLGATTALATRGSPASASRARVDLELSASPGASGAFAARGVSRPSVLPIVPQPRTSGRIVSANDLAVALRDNPESAGAPRKSRRMAVLTMLIALLGVAGVTFAYLRPDLARTTRGWLAVHWESARQEFQNAFGSSASPAVVTPDPADQPAPQDLPALPRHSLAATPTPPANSLTAPQPAPPQPQTAPPTAVASSAAPANAVATASDLDRSRKLYDRAIDAESRSDWTEAMRCYQAIQALPRSAWEADIVPRLSYARQMASAR
jgi:hypothetical protein